MFENQIEKFRMLYLENVVETVNRVVITGICTFNIAFCCTRNITSTPILILCVVGFCFGGVLAQMLAAHLWLLPQTDADHLMSRVVCITFGQPMIQSEQLSHVAAIFPDFGNNVHTIGLVDDSFPCVIERLDFLAPTTKVYKNFCHKI